MKMDIKKYISMSCYEISNANLVCNIIIYYANYNNYTVFCITNNRAT